MILRSTVAAPVMSKEKKLRAYTVIQGGLAAHTVIIQAERVEQQDDGSLRFYIDDELIGSVNGDIDAWWLSDRDVSSYKARVTT